MGSREATRVLRKRRTYVNQELHPWRHLSMLLCPQRAIYRDLLEKDGIWGAVFEVGFGTGSQVVQYADRVNWVTATEIESKAVEWAKRTWPLRNVEWVESNICRDDELYSFQYDTILCIEVLEHVDDPEAALLNLSKALRQGGTAWISVPLGKTRNKLHRWAWTPTDFEADLLKFFGQVNIDSATWPLILARCGNDA